MTEALNPEALATIETWCEEQGAHRAAVTTQGRNIPSRRIFQSFGFRMDSIFLWYHRRFR